MNEGAGPVGQPTYSIMVNEPPKFEVASYIANYSGRTVFRRLYLIGACCPPLREEAAKLAIKEAKKGADVRNFQDAVNLLKAVPGYRDTERLLETSWAIDQEKRNNKETQRLENELKGYKNNLIKESIRMGNEDLGSHYYRIGDLVNASKAYSRMRDYCTTPAHIASTAFRIIAVAIEQRNWMAVQSQVLKIQNLQMKQDDAARYQILLAPTTGLQRMCNGEYKDAANHFLLTDPAVGDQFNSTMSPNDVAVYGGLCALASMSRTELQVRVLDNATFRNFLELEPHIRRAISFFVACKYTQCLEILESYRHDYLLDLYLQLHVSRIYRRIREKSIVQYFEPFSSVRLDNMEKVFGEAALKSTANAASNGTDTISIALMDELFSLIDNSKLDARLDLEKNLLIANQPDLRAETYKEAEEMLDKFSKDAYLKLMRIDMLNAGLETKAPPSKKGKGVASDWEEEGTVVAGNGRNVDPGLFGGGGRSLRSGFK